MANVVLVPGLQNSGFYPRLDRQRRTIYYRSTELIVNGLSNFALDDSGTSPGSLWEVEPLVPYYSQTSTPWTAIEPLLTRLGHRCYTFAYDWRMNLIDSGVQLQRFIAEELGNATYTVLAYSMGGLIARVAYAGIPAGPRRDAWLRTTYLCCPHGGSYDAVNARNGWVDYESILAQIALAVGVLVRRVLTAPFGAGSQRERFNAVVSSWPSLYQLIPSDVGPWLGSDVNLPQLDNAPAWTSLNPNILQGQLNAGGNVRAYLASLLDMPRPEAVNTVCQGFDTFQSIARLGQLGTRSGYVSSTAGDGFVSLARAHLPGAAWEPVLTQQHQEVLTSAILLFGLPAYLFGPLPAAAAA